MLHRIFIAINLPKKVKKELSSFQLKHSELPARWTKKENLHITLLFIGLATEEELKTISKTIKEGALKHTSFSLKFNKICYGPPNKMPPRMVWVMGKKSEELSKLHKELKNSLTSNLKSFKSDNRIYSTHITLARINEWNFRKIEPEERLLIEESISLDFKVNSIEIMESQLKKTGPEYTILESIQLQ